MTMDAADMSMAETSAPPGGQSQGQPEPSVAEQLSAACVQATATAMAHMQQAMNAAGHTLPGTAD
jgi:hypothetical protein